MGGAVSSGEDNEELIDNLVAAGYVKSQIVERGLRLVDRGDYYLEVGRNQAYKDLAWKHGNIHISAPCIYAEVLECLDLRPGLSFLNLGSGTGYLSTIVGLILGVNGVNHGIELHADVVEYARSKLRETVRSSPAVDLMELCLPEFVCGNCLQFDAASLPMLYDRVYCGAAVPPEYESFISNLVKVGGIVVMPCQDQLKKVVRLSYSEWKTQGILPVSFANLIVPTTKEPVDNLPLLPERNPAKLQELCRAHIRAIIRNNVEWGCPELVTQCQIKTDRKTSGHDSSSVIRRQLVGHRIYEINTDRHINTIFGVISNLHHTGLTPEPVSDDESSSSEGEMGRLQPEAANETSTVEPIEEEVEDEQADRRSPNLSTRANPPSTAEPHESSEMEGSLPAGDDVYQMEEDVDDDNQFVNTQQMGTADNGGRLSPPRRKLGVADNSEFLPWRKGQSLLTPPRLVGERSKRKTRSFSEPHSLTTVDPPKTAEGGGNSKTTSTPPSLDQVAKRLKQHRLLNEEANHSSEDEEIDCRCDAAEDGDDSTDEGSSEGPETQMVERARRQENHSRQRRMSNAVRSKIASLPLPDPLKHYVDYFRD